MSKLATLQSKDEKRVIGLMSGTSMDGIDAALVKIKGHGLHTQWELMAFTVLPYPAELRTELLDLATAEFWPANRIVRLNVIVAEFFARAALNVVQKANISFSDVDLIGSHGQTLRHLPHPENNFDVPIRATSQIGEPCVIADRCQTITIGDFRAADMAADGTGAPLVPYTDFLMLRSKSLNRGFLNIGGIANITVLPQNANIDDVRAFDTGPGNMILDALTMHFFDKPYDASGALAAKGTVSKPMLSHLLEHEYFRIEPPKATGRIQFGEGYVQKLIADAQVYKLMPVDILATATELVAMSIYNAYRDFIAPEVQLDELIIGGGGPFNLTLMDSLKKHFSNCRIMKCEDVGLSSEAKEAVSFAILANETIAENPTNICRVTGARAQKILGKICL